LLLEGKVGIVTGAAQGLGEAIALLAAREGSRVVVSDVQAELGEAVASAICDAGGEAIFHPADVSKADEVEALVAAASARFGRIDWLCNNAVGGSGDFGPLDRLSDASWTNTIDVCLKGVFHGMKFAIPAMLAGGGGSIVNITTAGLHKGEAMLGAYIAAKGGVEAMTRSAAAEYSARGIRVNCVAPGGMVLRRLAQFCPQQGVSFLPLSVAAPSGAAYIAAGTRL